MSDLQAAIETNKGTINLTLFADRVPFTVANFVNLAQKGFYDGLKFHRVLDNFMVQGGCPQGTGTGGPGYKFANEVSDDLKHDAPGVMSMANSGPNTNGSQFFVMHEAKAFLDGKYNVFGKCAEISVINEIAAVPKKRERPIDDVVMTKVEIYRAAK